MASLWAKFQKEKIRASQKGNNNVLLVNSQVVLKNIRDEVEHLLREGRDTEAASYIKQFLNGAGAQHPLYPDWRYSIKCGNDGQVNIEHVPMNEEALKRNPFNGTIKFRIPEKYKYFQSINELVTYGHNRQIPIELDVEYLETFIGEMPLESMTSSEGKLVTATIVPKKFPGPFPIKIYASSIASLDFIEISIKEINDGVITIDNTQQDDARVFVVLKFDMETGLQSHIAFKINSRYSHTVEAHLMCSEIMLGIAKNGTVKGKDLRSNKQLFEIKGLGYDKEEVKEIEASIELLRILKNIQDYFNIEFALPEREITEDEYDFIWKLHTIIEKKCIEGNYNEFSIDADSEELMDKILEMFADSHTSYSLEFRVKEQQVELWEQKIILPETYHCFKDCRLKDRERLVEKRRLMGAGEVIKVAFVPLEENKYIAKYCL